MTQRMMPVWIQQPDGTFKPGEVPAPPSMIDRDEAYEQAAQRIEQLSGNESYSKAWKIAAEAVRKLKVLTCVN